MISNKVKYIYIACPWAPMGGGMFKIADYLVQHEDVQSRVPTLLPLDSRGGKGIAYSFLVLLFAIFKLIFGRLGGRLVGLHINVAERLSVFRKGILLLVARLLGMPVVLHLHAAQLPAFYNRLPAIGRFLIRAMFNSASVCIVLGERAKAFVTQELGVPESKVRILVNGVPVLESKGVRDVSDNRVKLLFLGNLMERKGVSDLLKAFASERLSGRKDWVARFAGGGDVEGYKKLADSLGLGERAQFLGWADQSKAATLMMDSDVLVLPSYDEGLPLVILEAFARSVAVVCTPVGEIPDFLTNGKDALFVKPGSIDEIADALGRLIEDAQLRGLLARNGKALYDEKFSFDRFVSCMYEIYGEFIPEAELNKPLLSRAE